MTHEKDQEDQNKYYLSYTKPPVLDMKWENRDINVIECKHFKVPSSRKWRLGENVALQKSRVTLTVVSSNNSRVVYTASSESCESRRFVRCWNKIERKHVQEQPNQFHFYNQNMGFVNRMDQNVAKYRIDIRMKKWWWSPLV